MSAVLPPSGIYLLRILCIYGHHQFVCSCQRRMPHTILRSLYRSLCVLLLPCNDTSTFCSSSHPTAAGTGLLGILHRYVLPDCWNKIQGGTKCMALARWCPCNALTRMKCTFRVQRRCSRCVPCPLDNRVRKPYTSSYRARPDSDQKHTLHMRDFPVLAALGPRDSQGTMSLALCCHLADTSPARTWHSALRPQRRHIAH